MFPDANDEGYGGYVLKHLNKEICSAKFDKFEKETSSTFRELLAVKYVLISFGYILKKHSVQVNIGNSSVCRILSIVSSKPHQQNLAIEVLNFCIQYQILHSISILIQYQINSSMDPKGAKLFS